MLLHGLLQSTAPVGQLGDMAEMLSLVVSLGVSVCCIIQGRWG